MVATVGRVILNYAGRQLTPTSPSLWGLSLPLIISFPLEKWVLVDDVWKLFFVLYCSVLKKIIQHLEMRQEITVCLQCSKKHCGAGPPQKYWFSKGSVLLFDLSLALDLGSGSVNLDALSNWSIANALWKRKIEGISCLGERITSKFIAYGPVGWWTNCSHLPGDGGTSQDKELLVLKPGLSWANRGYCLSDLQDISQFASWRDHLLLVCCLSLAGNTLVSPIDLWTSFLILLFCH